MKKKLFPNGILNSGAASLVRGLMGTSNPAVATVFGIVEGVVKRFKDMPKKNKESKVSGEGNVDWYEWLGIAASAFGLVYSVYLLVTGQMSLDEFNTANGVSN